MSEPDRSLFDAKCKDCWSGEVVPLANASSTSSSCIVPAQVDDKAGVSDTDSESSSSDDTVESSRELPMVSREGGDI